MIENPWHYMSLFTLDMDSYVYKPFHRLFKISYTNMLNETRSQALGSTSVSSLSYLYKHLTIPVV